MNINKDKLFLFYFIVFNLISPSVLTLAWVGVFHRRGREGERGRGLYIEIIADRPSPASPLSLASAAVSRNSKFGLCSSLSAGVSLFTTLSHMHANRIIVESKDGA